MYRKIKEETEYVGSLLLGKIYTGKIPSVTMTITIPLCNSGTVRTVYSFRVTILLYGGILNFINIYMVFMMKRSKEYGVKKVFGLQRLPLFLQIWMENQLLAFAALLTAWLLIEATQVPVQTG